MGGQIRALKSAWPYCNSKSVTINKGTCLTALEVWQDHGGYCSQACRQVNPHLTFYIVQEHLPREWCLLQWSGSSIDTFTGQSDLSNSLEELEVLLSSDSRLCKVDSKN